MALSLNGLFVGRIVKGVWIAKEGFVSAKFPVARRRKQGVHVAVVVSSANFMFALLIRRIMRAIVG